MYTFLEQIYSVSSHTCRKWGIHTCSCCRVTVVSACHVNTYIYLVNRTLLHGEAIPLLSTVWPFCCVITLQAAAFQVWLAAGLPRPQHHTVNSKGPPTCSMCLIYLRSICIQQKNHNPPLTQCVINTGIYLDFLCSGILLLCLVFEYQFKSNQNLFEKMTT